jgi:hypothetical protein
MIKLRADGFLEPRGIGALNQNQFSRHKLKHVENSGDCYAADSVENALRRI